MGYPDYLVNLIICMMGFDATCSPLARVALISEPHTQGWLPISSLVSCNADVLTLTSYCKVMVIFLLTSGGLLRTCAGVGLFHIPLNTKVSHSHHE